MAVSDTAIQIAPEVQKFVGETRKMLNDGTWVEAASGKTFPIYNPATGMDDPQTDFIELVDASTFSLEKYPLLSRSSPSLKWTI